MSHYCDESTSDIISISNLRTEPTNRPVAMNTRLVTETDRSEWDSFVSKAKAGTFFHLFAWKDIMEQVFGHKTWFLVAEQDSKIRGVLPLAEIKSRLFGHSLISLPFCAYGGAIGGVAAVRALEVHANEIAITRGVQYAEFRNLSPLHEDWPRQDLYATFRKQILDDDEANLQAVPRKQRAMIRKGAKNALHAKVGSTVDDFFDLYARNVKRHGTPALPKSYFAALKNTFGDDCEVLTVTTSDGLPISSVLTFYFKSEVLPYYAGDEVMARRLAANDFKYWQLMCRARERGCTLFDFGRSKMGTGQYSFKKNWGFTPTTLSYEFRLYKRDSVPQNNPLNPKYRALISIWRRLPLRLANALGPRIVKNLG